MNEIMRRKVELIQMFGDIKKFRTEYNGWFENDKLIEQLAKFRWLLKKVKIDEIEIKTGYRRNSTYLFSYINNYTFYLTGCLTSSEIATYILAVTLLSFARDNKLVKDFLYRNVTPLFERLSVVNGFIDDFYIEEIEHFIFWHIAEHLMGKKTDISQTVYAYFVEALEVGGVKHELY